MELKLDLDLKFTYDIEHYGKIGEYSDKFLARAKAVFWEIGRRLRLLETILGIEVEEVKIRETAKGFHVYITTSEPFEPQPETIVAIQLILMSDWKREVFNLSRIIEARKRGDIDKTNWNVLFAVKVRNGKVVSREEKTPLCDILGDKLIEGYNTGFGA
jgi:hypothetical protein